MSKRSDPYKSGSPDDALDDPPTRGSTEPKPNKIRAINADADSSEFAVKNPSFLSRLSPAVHSSSRSGRHSSASAENPDIFRQFSDQRKRLEQNAVEVHNLALELERGNLELVGGRIPELQEEYGEVLSEVVETLEFEASAPNMVQCCIVGASMCKLIADDVHISTTDDRENRSRIAIQKLVNKFPAPGRTLDCKAFVDWIYKSGLLPGFFEEDHFTWLEDVNLGNKRQTAQQPSSSSSSTQEVVSEHQIKRQGKRTNHQDLLCPVREIVDVRRTNEGRSDGMHTEVHMRIEALKLQLERITRKLIKESRSPRIDFYNFLLDRSSVLKIGYSNTCFNIFCMSFLVKQKCAELFSKEGANEYDITYIISDINPETKRTEALGEFDFQMYKAILKRQYEPDHCFIPNT